MREIFDVLGMELETAKIQLEKEKISFSVVETFPTAKEPIEGYYRVIKQEVCKDLQVLTVCKVPDAYR